MREKIRILFLAADPSDQTRTRLGNEYQVIREELERGQSADRFLLEPVFSVKIPDMTRAVKKFRPHIIHFSGHGSPDGELCFEDQDGKAMRVKPENLEGVFALLSGKVDCVVLNACYSETQATVISKHIPYVVGVKEVVTDQAAIWLAQGFYQTLAAGEALENAFKAGYALLQAAGFLGSINEPVLKVGSGSWKLVGPWGEPPRFGRGPPPAAPTAGLLVVLVAIGLLVQGPTSDSEPKTSLARVPTTEGSPVGVVEPGTDPKQGQINGIDDTGASLNNLRAALRNDGQLEIWGEVHLAELIDPETAQQYLQTLHVEVTLVDGAEGVTLIDTERRAWTVSLRPYRPLKRGDSVKMVAVLLGEDASHELHRIGTEIVVKESG